MSFGRLLAAGRSMVGGGQWGGRYQVRKGTRLPKFISPRNPFARGDASATTSLPLPGGAGETVNTPSLTATSAPTEKAEVRPPNLALLIAGRVARGLWSACKKVRRTKRPAIPVFGKPAVQSELSLETVKVVRNDLADADLEVVARGGGPGPVPGPQTNLMTAQALGAGTK